MKNYSKCCHHLLYSFGRVTTYTILGAIFGFIGGVVTFSNTTSGDFLLITGFLMVIVGFSLFRKNKIFNYFGA